MKKGIVAPTLAVSVALCAGCASVTQGTTHPLRIDTVTEAGQQVDDAECTLTNDQGTTIARSGASTLVRRSGSDLEISCAAPGQPKAGGRLVSRANAGLAGNILIGGGIGAYVDHTTGAAYTYPGWVRLVFGRFGVFDRRNEIEGVAMTSSSSMLVQGEPGSTKGSADSRTGVAPLVAIAVTQGQTFEYRRTDRVTQHSETVVLRAERVQGDEVSFNGGARLESTKGTVVRINSMLTGELDQVTPPGGWMPGGRLPSGTWKMRHNSQVPSSGMSYDLNASLAGEQTLVIQGMPLRTVRITLSGWAKNTNGMVTPSGRYEATAWLSPELQRVVRFEAKSRSMGSTVAPFDINETVELVRVGHE